MGELKRPEPVDVEKSINQFVIDSGGQLVSTIIPRNAETENADYFFDNPSIIVELKCFQKDLFNNEEDIPRMFSYFDKWKEKGLIEEGDEMKIIFGTKKIPNECWTDLLASASKNN